MEKEAILSYIEKHLSPSRRDHILRVAHYAKILAEKEGISPYKAEMASLLHDITKEKSIKWHREFLSSFEEKEEIKKLPEAILHARSARYLAEKEFQIQDPEILEAVYYHTTGKKDLSPLAQIVYAADMLGSISSQEAQKKLQKPLKELLLDKVSYTISFLIKKRKPVYKDTWEFYNWLVDG